jgi:hypothetical protein
MTITEHTEMRRTRTAALIVGGLAVAVGLALAISYLSRPPQMGTDEAAFKAVDALFTAVGMRDEGKLLQCEVRLHELRDDGKLPPPSAAHLDRVIARARSGGWESAAQMLYDFMRAQRREGRGNKGDSRRF